MGQLKEVEERSLILLSFCSFVSYISVFELKKKSGFHPDVKLCGDRAASLELTVRQRIDAWSRGVWTVLCLCSSIYSINMAHSIGQICFVSLSVLVMEMDLFHNE